MQTTGIRYSMESLGLGMDSDSFAAKFRDPDNIQFISDEERSEYFCWLERALSLMGDRVRSIANDLDHGKMFAQMLSIRLCREHGFDLNEQYLYSYTPIAQERAINWYEIDFKSLRDKQNITKEQAEEFKAQADDFSEGVNIAAMMSYAMYLQEQIEKVPYSKTVKQKAADSLKYFALAAAYGDPVAPAFAGVVCGSRIMKDIVPGVDLIHTARWMRTGIVANAPEAWTTLGLWLCENGVKNGGVGSGGIQCDDIADNTIRSLELYEHAANIGDPDAFLELALGTERGIFLNRGDAARPFKLLEEGALRGNTYCMLELFERNLKTSNSSDIDMIADPKDVYQTACYWLLKAAELGNEEALKILGRESSFLPM